MSTHAWPATRRATTPTPPCGCDAPEWLDPTRAEWGCANCCGAQDPACTCPGRTGPHFAAWSAARDALEAEMVAALAAVDAATGQVRKAAARRGVELEKHVKRGAERRAAAPDAPWQLRLQKAGRSHAAVDRAEAAVLDARARVAEVERRICELHAECWLCAEHWREAHSLAVRGCALVSATLVDARQ